MEGRETRIASRMYLESPEARWVEKKESGKE